jgi:hypothetical protein
MYLRPLSQQTKPYKVLIEMFLSPGDSLVLSQSIRSLHLQYPGEYLTDVAVHKRELFDHNPDITRLAAGSSFVVRMQNQFHLANERPIHFAQTHADWLGQMLGIPLTIQIPTPVVYVPDRERTWTPPWPSPFVLISSGGKEDMPVKAMGTYLAQQVAGHLTAKGFTVVQVGLREHSHRPLKGVVDMIGRTSIRDLVKLAYHSAGGVGGVTLLQHVYAALGKPYVCVNSREPRWFVNYPKQEMISPIGSLPCCSEGACWRNGLTPESLNPCALPVIQPDGETVPRCVQIMGDTRAVEVAIDRLFCSSPTN